MVSALIGRGISLFLSVIDGAIFLRIVLSWFVDPFSRIMGVLMAFTEPFIAPVRNLLARISGGEMRIDISPIVASFLVMFLQRLVEIIFY